jgi:hypothetical protein
MPLNPSLYRALSNAFKRGVKIQKADERMVYKVNVSQITGKQVIDVQPGRGGEDYKVCCPFCNDTRFRLQINHRWNTRDEKTGAYFGSSFVCCYNDGCDLNHDAPWRRRLDCHQQLTELTKPYIARHRQVVYEEPIREKKPIKLPDKALPITHLDASHEAIRYLEGRRFNIDKLFDEFRVLFCLDDPNWMVAGRIIIPVYMNEQLVGWQARYVGEPKTDNVPKYYTCPGTQRNQILYNYDAAKYFNFAVLVEGPTDVWRTGRASIAPLGSSVSSTQIQLMQAAWNDGGLALMLDPDYVHKPSKDPKAPSPYEVLRSKLSDPTLFKRGLLEVVLPDGMDPGKFDTPQSLWQVIRQVAAQKGYKIP